MKAASITTAAPLHDLDLELAERHRYGDTRAFDEVYARHAEMVYNLALRLSGQVDEAADLTQEVFLRVFRHLGSFCGRSALKTWIFRIALNHCRERLCRFRPALTPIASEAEEDQG
ncbi:MAG: sigma-70 family RNA polymerase sigma factor, partial [Acidobacteriota bacterium]|nr:sigma-70 family RNA polymerase sigma factor [Acidobacteriota bacterium]